MKNELFVNVATRRFESGSTVSLSAVDGVTRTYTSMIEKLDDAIGMEGDWHLSVTPVYSSGDTPDGIKVSINNSRVTVERTILDTADGFVLSHDLMVVDGRSLQGKGLANIINTASVEVADLMGIKSISVHANIDVGGYAWLRKGALPRNGVNSVIAIAKSNRNGNKALLKELDKTLSGFSSEAEAIAFIRGDEFSKYKSLFLGTDWYGGFDTTDPMTRALIVGRKEVTPDDIRLAAALKPVPETRAISKPVARLTANEKLLNEYTRHQTYLMRYADGLGSELATLLDSTNDDLNDTLLKWLAKVEDRSLSSSAGRSWQKEFETAINSVRAPIWDDIQLESFMQLEQLALTEAAVGAAIIQSTIPVALGLSLPPAAHLTGIVRSQPLEGRVLKEWLEKAKQADINTVVTGAKAGIIQGQTPAQITRNLMGSSGVDYSDGIVRRKATRELNSLVRTIVNGVQTEAKQALYEANADIIQDEIFIATLDSGTTLVCAGNDNKVFKRGEGPMPPLHFGCRSTRVPYINPDNFGNRGFDPTTETELLEEYAKKNNLDIGKDRDSLPRGHKTKYDAFARKRKRELIGQVPALTSYNKWLKEQSVTFQNETLGKTRAELFRSGKLSIDKFTSATGEPLTLKQLAKKYDLNL